MHARDRKLTVTVLIVTISMMAIVSASGSLGRPGVGSVPRTLSVETKTIASTASSVTIGVDYDAVAGDNVGGLGFSISFNPAHFTYVSVEQGSGLPSGWVLLPENIGSVGQGRVGFGIGSLGTSLPGGLVRLLTITFSVNAAAKCGVTSPITIVGTPVAIEVSDSTANPLPAPAVVAGGVTVTPNPIVFSTGATLTSAVLNASYSQTVLATGGSGTISSYAVTSGALPAGLALNGVTGAITGVAQTLGTFSLTVTAIDSNGCTGSRAFTLAVVCPTITLLPATLSAGVLGTAYSATISASTGGGQNLPAIVAPYTYAVTAGNLPAGLTLDSAAGAISGTPTAVGTSNFTITATDLNGCTGSRTYSLTIACPTITLSPATLPGGVLGTAYSQSVAVSSPAGTYTYAVTTGSLPAGLVLNSATGAITGTPTVVGTANFTITATGASACTGSKAYSLTIACPVVTLPASLPNATAGTAYNASVAVSSPAGTYTYAVTTGTLPAGLVLNSATGAITGTPTTSGSASFTITATGFGTCTGSRAYSLTVTCPVITLATPATLPAATAGTPYSQSVVVSSPTGSYSYAVTTGTLPSGLVLSSAGAITGTSLVTGTFSFTITATGFGTCTGSRAYSLTIGCPTITLSPVLLPPATQSSAYPGQTIIATGAIGTPSFNVTGGSLPPGITLNAATGMLSGTPTTIGSFTFTVTATDANGCTGASSLMLMVQSPSKLIIETKTIASSVNTVTVGIDYDGAASDNVFGLGFSVSYISNYLQFVSASPGPALNNWTLYTNPTQDTNGGSYIGIGLIGDFNTFAPLPGGVTRLLNLTFNVLPEAKCGVGAGLVILNSPVEINLSDAQGNPLPVPRLFVGTVTVTPNPIVFANSTLPGAVVGAAYSQGVSVTGGSGTFSAYAVTTGSLPPGLALNATTGLITGTPSTLGNFSFTVMATDSNGCTGSREVSLTVGCPTITLLPESLPAPRIGDSYSQTIVASPSGSYTYVVTAGSLPPGLSLNSATGLIAGISTIIGSYNFTITATAFGSCTGSRAFSLTVTPRADLVLQQNGPPLVETGREIIWTLEVTSLGPSPAAGASLTDRLPAGLTGVTAVCESASGGAACPTTLPIVNGTLTATIPVLPSGGRVAIRITATAPATAGTLWNTATVTPPSGVEDVITTNNTSNVTTSVTSAPPPAVANLSVASAGTTAVQVNGQLNFTFRVVNSGPGSANGTSFTNQFSVPISGLTITCTATGGAVCPPSTPEMAIFQSAEAQSSISQTIPTLPVNGQLTFKVAGSAPSTPQSLNTSVTLTPPPGVTDPDTGDGAASVTTSTQNNPPPQTDLSIVKTGPTTVTPGGQLTYSIVVTNNGASAADGATITDNLSNLLTNVQVTCSETGGAACGTTTVDSGNQLLVTIATLPVGATVTLTVTATAPASGSFTNIATVNPPSAVNDSAVDNNVSGSVNTTVLACQTITVTPAALSGGTITSSYDVTFVRSGGVGTITWSQSGTLPPGLTFNPTTGSISGTPSITGTYTFIIRATDGNACFGERSYTVTIGTQPFYEADVAPRPGGDGTNLVTDWVQVGRFVVGLDVPQSGGEFQRADSAPRSTFGNGRMEVSDWVQAGRYVVGLDPKTLSGGPSSLVALNSAPESEQVAVLTPPSTLRVVDTRLAEGEIGTVELELETSAEVSALGFTLRYDPRELALVDAIPLPGEPVRLLVNRQHESEGRLAVALALPPGERFAAGTTRILRLRLLPVVGAARPTATISLDGSLVDLQVVSPEARLLTRPLIRAASVAIDRRLGTE